MQVKQAIVRAGILVLALSLSAAATDTYTGLRYFNATDGAQVMAGLIFDSQGNLYGTTNQGGTYGDGTVFELTPLSRGGWSETVLYSFGGVKYDAANPQAGLVLDAAGNLYGTTYHGGRYNKGTAFELSPTAGGWQETVIHSFGYGHDGFYPLDPLAIDASGNLYGTTYYGGAYDTCTQSGVTTSCGMVFELSPKGTEWTYAVIHSFAGGTTDGNFPVAGISINASGDLLGQASYGGEYGGGVLFQLTPASGGKWEETILHPWGRIHDGRPDGTYPYGTLVFDSEGNFYGTSIVGGTHGDMGMVFKFVPNSEGTGWVEKSLHGFGDGADGKTPLAGVILDSQGNIYGTTSAGGTSDENGSAGYGIVYELSPDGDSYQYKILSDFNGTSEGAYSAAPLVMDSAGNLYGTTEYGGLINDCTTYAIAGCGVVFELSAP
jgi:uncharacterized repeat protein (TIGR03803 family)